MPRTKKTSVQNNNNDTPINNNKNKEIIIENKINNNEEEENNKKYDENETIDKEYSNYVKEPLDKIISIIDSQINYFNVEDVIKCLNLINNLKINIRESIFMLIEYDKILSSKFEKLDERKTTLYELNQLFFEHNKLNIIEKLQENQTKIDKTTNEQNNTDSEKLNGLTKAKKTKIDKTQKLENNIKINKSKKNKSKEEVVQEAEKEVVQEVVQENTQKVKPTLKTKKQSKNTVIEKPIEIKKEEKPKPVEPQYCQQCNIYEIYNPNRLY